MAKTRKDSAKEALWQKHLTRFTESGMSVREFCKRERLAESAFYFWRRTIRKQENADNRKQENAGDRKRENADNEKPAFVKAVINDESGCESSILLKSAGGLELRLPSAIPVARLAELVRALETRGES